MAPPVCSFLQVGSAGLAGLSLPHLLRLEASGAVKEVPPRSATASGSSPAQRFPFQHGKALLLQHIDAQPDGSLQRPPPQRAQETNKGENQILLSAIRA